MCSLSETTHSPDRRRIKEPEPAHGGRAGDGGGGGKGEGGGGKGEGGGGKGEGKRCLKPGSMQVPSNSLQSDFSFKQH